MFNFNYLWKYIFLPSFILGNIFPAQSALFDILQERGTSKNTFFQKDELTVFHTGILHIFKGEKKGKNTFFQKGEFAVTKTYDSFYDTTSCGFRGPGSAYIYDENNYALTITAYGYFKFDNGYIYDLFSNDGEAVVPYSKWSKHKKLVIRFPADFNRSDWEHNLVHLKQAVEAHKKCKKSLKFN